MTSKKQPVPTPVDNPASAQSPSTLALIRKIQEEEQVKAFQDAKEKFAQQVEIYQFKGNVAKIIGFAIDFIEEVAPSIGRVMNVAFKGPLKMNLLVELVSTVLDIAVVSIDRITNFAEHLIEITINKNKHLKEITATQTSQEQKKIKKNSSRLKCGRQSAECSE